MEYRICCVLNPQVEEKPDVTYNDVGGCKEQIEKLREVVETPLLYVSLSDLTKGDLIYRPDLLSRHSRGRCFSVQTGGILCSQECLWLTFVRG